mgnify:CR=1 FL=1
MEGGAAAAVVGLAVAALNSSERIGLVMAALVRAVLEIVDFVSFEVLVLNGFEGEM